MERDIDDILKNLPFQGEGCDMEEIEPGCENCGKFLTCLDEYEVEDCCSKCVADNWF